jgi:hypothetical protein
LTISATLPEVGTHHLRIGDESQSWHVVPAHSDQLRRNASFAPVLAEIKPSGDIFVKPEQTNQSNVQPVVSSPVDDPMLFAVSLAGEDALLTTPGTLPASLGEIMKQKNWTWSNMWKRSLAKDGVTEFIYELKNTLTGSEVSSDLGIVAESPEGTLVMYRPPSAHGLVRVLSVLLLFASAVVLGIGWRYGSTPGMYPYVEDCRL